MSEITWALKKVNLSELREYENNPRFLSKEKLRILEESIFKFGMAEPLVINLDNIICGGHGRKKALEKMKITEVDVYYPNRQLNEEEFDELNVRLNKNTAGDFDYDILANRFEFHELEDMGFSAKELGMDENTIAQMSQYDMSDDNFTPNEESFNNAIIQYALVFDNEEQQQLSLIHI